jgi:hypothetical protein
LRQFFDRISGVIWASPDPLGYMQALWTEKPKRGAPRRTSERDFKLAVDIQELRNEGRTVDQACLDQFERLDGTDQALDPRTPRNIYFAQDTLEVRAGAALRWLLKQERDAPE